MSGSMMCGCDEGHGCAYHGQGIGHVSDPDAAAAARVREWLVARDSFYGREAGEDDVLCVEAIYGDEGVTGHATLSLDDLRTLVNAPPVESYDDRIWPSDPPGTPGLDGGS